MAKKGITVKLSLEEADVALLQTRYHLADETAVEAFLTQRLTMLISAVKQEQVQAEATEVSQAFLDADEETRERFRKVKEEQEQGSERRG